MPLQLTWHNSRRAYLASENGKRLATGFAHKTLASRGGRGIRGVPRTRREAKGSSTSSKARLLASHCPRAHDLIQQTTAWSPHGRGPCLTGHKTKPMSCVGLLVCSSPFVLHAKADPCHPKATALSEILIGRSVCLEGDGHKQQHAHWIFIEEELSFTLCRS